jgi:phage gp36-like protein
VLLFWTIPTDFQNDVDSFIRELSNENVGVGLEANDEEIESDGEGDHGYDTGNE